MKDYLRDYSTAAFRFFAANGKSAEEFKNKIYREALEEVKRKAENDNKKFDVSKPCEIALIQAEEAVNQKLAEIKDMEAVEKVIAQLRSKWRVDIISAIEFIYFESPETELCKNDIQDRVRKASIEIPAGERTIYYWLKQAREAFAKERGLRIKRF